MPGRPAAALALFVLALVPGRIARAQLVGWETAGPDFHQVNAITPSPGAPTTVYAAGSLYEVSQSAIFASDDAGGSWRTVFDAPAGDFFVEILVDPSNPQNIYAGALGNLVADVYRSVDGGASWGFSRSVSPYCSPSLAAGPGGTVLLACGTQLFSSPDEGASWMTLTAPFTEPTRLVAVGDGLLAYGPTRIFRGSPDGRSWSPLAAAPAACPQINVVRADPSDPLALFAGTGLLGGSGLQCGGVFRSTDSGASWGEAVLTGFFVSDVAVDPEDPATVYASASSLGTILPRGGVFRSVDHGVHWETLHLPAAGATELALSGSGQILYAATSIGAFTRPIRKPIVVPPR